LTTALLTALVGVLVGAVSAHVGGWFNNSIMRLTDAFLAFPLIAGVVIFQQLISMTTPTAENPTGEPNVFTLLFEELDPLVLALILFSWMPHARITNSLVMRLKQADFILASRSLGAGHFRVVFHHLIPNTVSSAVVLAARDIGGMVVLQATLTFIGVVDGSEWGALLAVGRRWIIGAGGNPLQYWWVFIPATLALVLFGVGWNLLGDGLNDWLNPRRH
jgi:peptide/nickel transport system permease protein